MRKDRKDSEYWFRPAIWLGLCAKILNIFQYGVGEGRLILGLYLRLRCWFFLSFIGVHIAMLVSTFDRLCQNSIVFCLDGCAQSFPSGLSHSGRRRNQTHEAKHCRDMVMFLINRLASQYQI